MHLASERETSVAELARLILAVTGDGDGNGGLEHHPARRGEVERNFALARRAAELLDWRASVPLEDGLARTVAWFRQQAAGLSGR